MKQLGRAVLAALLACACGGPEAASDGGPDGQAIGVDGGPVAVCSAPSDCDDGQHCNGTERCEPGAAGAGADGCVAGTPPCGAGEICDEAADRCVPDDCAEPDADNDGHDRIGCGDGDDCDDNDPNRYPGNFEVCDAEGHDEDCNPETISGDPDRDGDGHIDRACWNVRMDGSENRGTDCDDGRNTVHPDAPESCNGIDDDCDGMIDEGVLSTFHYDADGDGFGCIPGADGCLPVQRGCVVPAGYVSMSGDCDDRPLVGAAIHPAAAKVCNGVDDNCDGLTDPGCACTNGTSQPCGTDVGECTIGTQTCVEGMWGACGGSQGPRTEMCNGVDDDCDGLTDEELLVMCYTDGDSDTYGTGSSVGRCPDASRPHVDFCPSNSSHRAGDCNDANGMVNPGATEVCNGVDDDCDGMVDEGVLETFYRDVDGDNYGRTAESVMACSRPTGYALVGGDCDDGETGNPWAATVNPAAVEVCNGRDDDCDGVVDPGCDCITDTNRPCGTDVGQCRIGTQTCVAGAWGACGGGGQPPVPEVCNGFDDDCDGLTDEGLLVMCYTDGDLDGHGTGSLSGRCPDPSRGSFGFCPLGSSNVAGDCDDSTANASPSNTEALFPCDGIDNDCDGRVDEAGTNQIDCYRDLDGDTYGSGPSVPACTCAAGWATRAGDCQDTGARAHLIHPGASFQTVGHCDGEPTNCTYDGRPGCMRYTPCPSCPGGMGIAFCGAAASFEYDCVSGIERQPQAGCGPIGGGFPGCSTSPHGTLSSTTSADCGTVVTRGSCAISCELFADGTMTLGCR